MISLLYQHQAPGWAWGGRERSFPGLDDIGLASETYTRTALTSCSFVFLLPCGGPGRRLRGFTFPLGFGDPDALKCTGSWLRSFLAHEVQLSLSGPPLGPELLATARGSVQDVTLAGAY